MIYPPLTPCPGRAQAESRTEYGARCLAHVMRERCAATVDDHGLEQAIQAAIYSTAGHHYDDRKADAARTADAVAAAKHLCLASQRYRAQVESAPPTDQAPAQATTDTGPGGYRVSRPTPPGPAPRPAPAAQVNPREVLAGLF